MNYSTLLPLFTAFLHIKISPSRIERDEKKNTRRKETNKKKNKSHISRKRETFLRAFFFLIRFFLAHNQNDIHLAADRASLNYRK